MPAHPSEPAAAGGRRRGPLRIGLISDTHGLLRPEALAWLAGCDHIVHAGDIGDAGILQQLRVLAPLTAVRGNNDHGSWADTLKMAESLQFDTVRLHLLHDLADLAIDPVAAGVQVVVSGHSHRPAVQPRQGVLYVNPGSAGPRRFRLPVTLAELRLRDGTVDARIHDIEVRS